MEERVESTEPTLRLNVELMTDTKNSEVTLGPPVVLVVAASSSYQKHKSVDLCPFSEGTVPHRRQENGSVRSMQGSSSCRRGAVVAGVVVVIVVVVVVVLVVAGWVGGCGWWVRR